MTQVFYDKKRVSKLLAVLTLFALSSAALGQPPPSNSPAPSPSTPTLKPEGKPTTAVSCAVDDPTGTPLNVRSEPAGKIIASLPNGSRVKLATIARDRKGSEWASISFGDISGWVLRAHLSCS